MILSKAKLTSYVIAILAVVILLLLWKNAATALENAKNTILTLEAKLSISKKNEDTLAEYLKTRDKEIENLEKEHSIYMKNIPANQCGDAIPSMELLEYYKGNHNE